MRKAKWPIVAAAFTAIAAALVLGPFSLGRGGSGGVSLAEAASRIEGESMRMRLQMRVEEPSSSYSLTGTARSSADGSRMTLAATAITDGESVRMRGVVIGDDMWFRFPRPGGIMPPGKRWVHFLETKSAPESLTPSEFARFLAEADEVRVAGDERVLGKLTTKYEGVLNVNELAEEVGGETAERFKAVAGDKEAVIPIEAWIANDDGRPVRLHLYGEDEKGSVDITADVLEYGVRVDAEPPAARTVIEERELERMKSG